jgi:Carbohydrate esterase, sialic acid-specific acetylesterase
MSVSGAAFFRNLLRPLVHRFFAVHAHYHQIYLQWAMRLDPSGVTFTTIDRKTEVPHHIFQGSQSDTAVILAIGASNIANEGDPGGLFAPVRGVYNFNFLNGRCYVAKDPLLGATMDRSNVLTRVGDRLVASGLYDRVLLVPIACGGTFISEWAPGGRMHPRIRKALWTLRRAGIRSTHILWQQGEAEANQPCTEPDGSLWSANFTKIASAIRSHGVDAPIYVAQSTICRGERSELIRNAQRAVVRPDDGVFSGPDLDLIGVDRRWDGCHFSVSGMESAADLWLEAVMASDMRRATAGA